MNDVKVVIPARNEEDVIGPVVRSVFNTFKELPVELSEVIVVSDSEDKTSEQAKAAGATVLEGPRRGLGAAMYKGLKYASDSQCQFIVSLDGDGQVDLQETPKFLGPLLDDQADLVVGSRFQNTDMITYKYPAINRFGVWALATYISFFSGTPVTDSHGGLRAMRKKVAQQLEMIGNYTYVQESIVDAAQKGFRIIEIPSVWNERKKGESRVVHSIPKYIANVLPVLIKRAVKSKNKS